MQDLEDTVPHDQCECNGYRFFWASEINGWRGYYAARLTCLRCGRPSLWQRLLYWFYGYKNNNQVDGIAPHLRNKNH